jgi:hypothetical protein
MNIINIFIFLYYTILYITPWISNMYNIHLLIRYGDIGDMGDMGESCKTLDFSIPAYKKDTQHDKATKYATYYTRNYHASKSVDEQKKIFERYYNHYNTVVDTSSNVSTANEGKISNNHENNEIRKYIVAMVLKELKKYEPSVISRQFDITKIRDKNVNNIVVNVSVIPISQLNLSCFDLIEYFDKAENRSMLNTHDIVWVNRIGHEKWEFFDYVTSTETKYKIGVSSTTNLKDLTKYSLSQPAQERLRYVS